MANKKERYNLYIAVASNGTITLPLPTAYGHASSDIFVLDSLSAFYTATGGASTAAYGGIMKALLSVNSTAAASAAFVQVAPVSYYPTAATSGVSFGGLVWESVNGIPCWPITATAQNISDTGLAPTAYYLRYTFTGAYATGAPAVETFATFHFENPGERR